MPLASLDWPEVKDDQISESEEDRIIQSMFWDLPESMLDGWLPFSACLHYRDLRGPVVEHSHGIDLGKNQMAYWCGPRGGTKTLSLSFYLSKILRIGKPVWADYPISFFVAETDEWTGKESCQFIRNGPCSWINLDGRVSYYESMPLDMDKFYTFHKAIRKGAVGIDELQYFVEARTSGRYQNRILSYQIMQIRKTANSFMYTVQNPKWVDNRFGWSADFECMCHDVSRMPYDRRAVARPLEEGEIAHWTFRDLSGMLTGTPWSENERNIGPYQFDAGVFWNIFPTHYIIDVFQALAGPDRDKLKREKESRLIEAIELAANEYLEQGGTSIPSNEFLDAINSHLPEPTGHTVLGRIINSMGIKKLKRGGPNQFVYDFTDIIEATKENK